MKTALALLFVVTGCLAAGDDTSDCESPQTVYPDRDGDGYGDSAKAEAHCVAPAGFVAQAGDCHDDNPAAHPGASEVCDAVDNDCDGMIDDADPSLDMTTTTTFYRDVDGDGFGIATTQQ